MDFKHVNTSLGTFHSETVNNRLFNSRKTVKFLKTARQVVSECKH